MFICTQTERQGRLVVNGLESVVSLPESRFWFCSFYTCDLGEVSYSFSARDSASVEWGCQ